MQTVDNAVVTGVLRVVGAIRTETAYITNINITNLNTYNVKASNAVIVNMSKANTVYDTGIRVNSAAATGYSSAVALITIGGVNNSVSGTMDGQWTIIRNSSGNLAIVNNGYVDTAGFTLYRDGSAPAWKGTKISLSNHGHSYLPLAGGTMTGNITYNMYSSSQIPLKVYGGTSSGQHISVGAGGATIVGGGESAKAFESIAGTTTENLYLTSDSTINFYTNCDTIGNRVGVILDSTRYFYPDVTNTGYLGTSSNKWLGAFITTVYGSLSGNAASASKLATARTITLSGSVTGSASFDGSGNITISTSTNHTHNYAGSASAGGPANSALAIGFIASDEIRFVKPTWTEKHTVFVGFKWSDGTTEALISAYDFRNGNGGERAAVIASSFTGPLIGNASTATKLQTARTITLAGGITGSASFDGSGNISIATTMTSHTHSQYLPLAGGTMTGLLTANRGISIPTVGSSWVSGMTQTQLLTFTGNSKDSYHPMIKYVLNAGHVINIGALGTYMGFFGYKAGRTDNAYDCHAYLDMSGNTFRATSFTGPLNGNASTASTLQTARTITLAGSVTGSASFNGGSNITITTSTNHAHSQYLPLTGGTMTGELKLSGGGNRLRLINSETTPGVIFHINDSEFHILLTDATNPSNATYNSLRPFYINKSSGRVQMNCGASISGTLNVSSTVTAPTFSGNLSGNATTATSATSATTATRLATARDIFGRSFNGTVNIAGQGVFYGTNVAAGSRYTNSALQIRECGLVGGDQTDIGYAPAIGFHWGEKNGATLAMAADGTLYYNNIKGELGNICANFTGFLSGNAATATKLQTARTITLSGSVTGSASFDGSGNITISTTTNHGHSYLPLAGGTMTGNISVNMYSYTSTPIKIYGGDANGQGLSIGAGGGTIIGSGESNVNLEPLVSATTEKLTLASDNDIELFTQCQTIDNRKKVTLSNGCFTTDNPSSARGSWNTPKIGCLTVTLADDSSQTSALVGVLGGVRKYGIDLLDKGNDMRLYAGTGYLRITSSTAYLNWDVEVGNNLTAKGNIFVTNDVTVTKSVKATDFLYKSTTYNVVYSNKTCDRLYFMDTSDPYLEFNNSKKGKAYGIRCFASDVRLKDNIKDSEVSALSTINKIKHFSFTWKETGDKNENGYVAQELEKINQRFVLKVPQREQLYDEDGNPSKELGPIIDYSYQVDDYNIFPYITKAIQEEDSKVEALTARVQELEKETQLLRKQVDQLRQQMVGM